MGGILPPLFSTQSESCKRVSHFGFYNWFFFRHSPLSPSFCHKLWATPSKFANPQAIFLNPRNLLCQSRKSPNWQFQKLREPQKSILRVNFATAVRSPVLPSWTPWHPARCHMMIWTDCWMSKTQKSRFQCHDFTVLVAKTTKKGRSCFDITGMAVGCIKCAKNFWQWPVLRKLHLQSSSN